MDLLLLSTKLSLEFIYGIIFVICASSFYLVVVQRAGDDIPRKEIDRLFFVMIGVASLIWVLSKMAPVPA